MPNPALSAAVSRVRRAALPDEPAETDGRLLARFARTRDEPAFAELVRRLGPMVLGVCRRVSGDAHLADDAFQAAFLVLARRAADVRPAEAVRGWLYGVAVRVAREARSMSARRRSRELPVATLPDRPTPVAEAPDADALRILDEEVAALPEALRIAVVLCELDGVSRREAADRLSVPEGTLSSRLAKARKVLAARLRQRGVALSAAGLSAALGTLASAGVPPGLAERAAAVATASAPVPLAVASLSNGVFRTMFLQKLKVVGCGGLLLAAAGLIGWGGRPGASAQEPPKVPLPARAAEKKAEPAAKPVGPGTLLVARAGPFWALTPDGKKLAELELPDGTQTGGRATFSPDGKRAALLVVKKQPPRPPRVEGGADDPWPFQVVIRRLDQPGPEHVWDTPAEGLSLCWTADGKRVVLSKEVGNLPDLRFESVLLDPDTGKTENLAAVRVLDCARDGKTYLVEDYDEVRQANRLALWSADDKKVRLLTELRGHAGGCQGRLAPDGTKVLYIDADPERKDAFKWGVSARVYVLDVATKTRERLADFPENAQACGAAWSPDGKRVAYTWKQLHEDLYKKDTISADEAVRDTEAFLIVADADGRNPKTVASDKGPYATNMILSMVDWR